MGFSAVELDLLGLTHEPHGTWGDREQVHEVGRQRGPGTASTKPAPAHPGLALCWGSLFPSTRHFWFWERGAEIPELPRDTASQGLTKADVLFPEQQRNCIHMALCLS